MRMEAFSAALVAATWIAAAKGPTSKVLVTGGDLAGVVEITDASSLRNANLFAANFLDTARHAAPAPSTADRYRVTFYLPDDSRGLLARIFDRPRLRVAYVVY